jgi:hypothetical protein
MKLIFETAIASVQSAYPSIYSKEDVIRMIQDIRTAVEVEDLNRPNISQQDVNGMLDEIREGLIEGIKNVDFEDFVCLELNHNNQIEIDIDMRGVCDNIEEAFDLACSEHAEVK